MNPNMHDGNDNQWLSMTVAPPILPQARMKIACRIMAVVILCGLWVIAYLVFTLAQTPDHQLLEMLASSGWLLGFVISLAYLRGDWRRVRYYALIAPLVCLVSCAGV